MFLGSGAALPRNFIRILIVKWLVELDMNETPCSESNAIGRRRVIWPSDEVETILTFWTVFRA